MKGILAECKQEINGVEITPLTIRQLLKVCEENPGTLSCIEDKVRKGVPKEFAERLEVYEFNRYDYPFYKTSLVHASEQGIFQGRLGDFLRKNLPKLQRMGVTEVGVSVGVSFGVHMTIQFTANVSDLLRTLNEGSRKEEDNSQKDSHIKSVLVEPVGKKKSVSPIHHRWFDVEDIKHILEREPWFMKVLDRIRLGKPAPV